jgi:peptidoglycan/xylan/chitin deacetylase (PgdA/CDA1 family)
VNARDALSFARTTAAELRARRSSREVAIVLVYHRIDEVGGSSALELSPAVSRSAIRQELLYLRRRYRIVAPSAICEAIAARSRGERLPVAVTFDDDTRSHVDDAMPLLDELDIVGGFFVGGGSLHGDARPWWESLQLAVDHGRLGAGLSLPRLDVDAALRREPYAIRRLGSFVETLEPAARRSLQAELAAPTSDLPAEPGLDADALRRLAERHEVGFHPRSHDRLELLADAELVKAVTEGRHEIEQAIGRALSSIAYPHGSADARVAAAARAAGYASGFAGSNRAAVASDDALLIPRLDPWHTSLSTFAATVAAAALRA